MDRLYDGCQQVRNLYSVRLGEKGGEAPPRVFELPLGPLGLVVLRPPARGGKMAESRDERLVAEARGLCQGTRSLSVLLPHQMPLCAPEDPLQPPRGRRPLVFHDGR